MKRGSLSRFLQGSAGLRPQRLRPGGSAVAAAAGVVAFGFLGSRLLGIVRSMAIAHAFGTDPELDAYWVAFRLPDLVFQVLAGATLSAAFIPTFSRVRVRSGEAEAWRLASSVLNLVALATFIAAAVAFLLAPLLVPLLAPGLGEETGRQTELRSEAIDLTRLMLLSPIFFGVSGMLTGILNARQHFFAPALAPMIYNLSIIIGALLLAGPMGVQGLAVAVVIGSLGHLLVQAPALRSVGMHWQPIFDFGSAGVREVARLMGPRVVGLAAAQVNFVVLIFFASFVSDGAISAVNYAFLMAMLPVGVVGMAISTAVFPTLAEQAATSQLAPLRASLARSLRLILFLSIPASVGLALLAEPVIRVLLQRGAFGPDATTLVAALLVWFAIGIAAQSAIEIVSRGFYALADTRTPVRLAVLAMVLNVALCAAFIGPFGVRGLAAAVSFSSLIEAALLVVTFERRIAGFGLRETLTSLGRTVLASAAMAVVVLAWLWLLGQAGVTTEGFGGALLVTASGGALGLAAFVAAAAALRSAEAEMFITAWRE